MKINVFKLLKMCEIYYHIENTDTLEMAYDKIKDFLKNKKLYVVEEKEIIGSEDKHYQVRIFSGDRKMAFFRHEEGPEITLLVAALKADPDFLIDFIPWEKE